MERGAANEQDRLTDGDWIVLRGLTLFSPSALDLIVYNPGPVTD